MSSCNFPIPYWLLDENGKGDVAYFVYGRYQPGHRGHTLVFDNLINGAREENTENHPWEDANGNIASNVFVFVSATHNKRNCSKKELIDKKKACENPLDPFKKVDLLIKQNPEINPHINFVNMEKNPVIIYDKENRTIAASIAMLLQCYNKIVLYVGGDHIEDQSFEYLTNYYPIEIKSAGDRDPDRGEIEGMSSSKIRLAAINVKKLDSSDENYEIIEKNVKFGDVKKELIDEIIGLINEAYIKSDKGGTRYKRKRKTRKHRKR